MPTVSEQTTLELSKTEGAFATLEDWLREHGFFEPGGEHLAADLYLGYSLSESLRRDATPSPLEPCPLPSLACSLRGRGTQRDNLVTCRHKPNDRSEARKGRVTTSHGGFSVGAWEAGWTEAGYRRAIEQVRSAIGRGDVYQVNLVQHLAAPFAGDPSELAAVLARFRPLYPKPFVGDGWAIVSASPELFLARRGRRVWTMPIKGTRPAGRAAELGESAKDAAEHVMIVDLERNDLSRVCEPGSIRWPELMAARAMAGVEHMVSTVEGSLRDGIGLAELLEATFPGGSVTGAPKIAAVDLIAGLEPVGRGASMGALGCVHGNGDLELALTIRTFAISEGRIHFWVGGGVVWDSDPAAEVEESWTKARPLLDAIGGSVR